MPDAPENPPKVTSRHRPRLTELSKETTEDDLWNLDDEAPARPETPAEEPAAPAGPEAPAAEDPTPDEAPKAAIEPRGVRQNQRAEKPRVSRHPGKAARPDDPAAAVAPEPVVEEPEPAVEVPAAKPAAAPFISGRKEAIGLAVAGMLTLAILIWWAFSLFENLPTARLGDDQPDFPAEGTHAVVEDARTYWREPVLRGEDADVVRQGVEIIPAVEITLSSGDSGILRVIFRNAEGDSVGDNISLSFLNGVFTGTGSATAEFAATDGFNDPSEFNAYRVGNERWRVEVLEGPSGGASGDALKQLFVSPISPNRR